MKKSELGINSESIRTELSSYKGKPYECLLEYIWNSFDAGATQVELKFNLPNEGLGYIENLKIIDNGKGWDFDDHAVTNNFISSTKRPNKNKTIPKGKYGRGRYTFIWIAKQLEAFSKGKKLTLQHNTKIEKEKAGSITTGTEVNLIEITQDLSGILSSSEGLSEALLLEFGWFLIENENYKILINGEEIDITKNIKESKSLGKDHFSEEIKEQLDKTFEVRIILWDKKPSEYSKYYLLNENGVEIFKENTGLNKKSDNFWHSIYIKSTLFTSLEDTNEKESDEMTLDFEDKKIKKIKRQIIQKVKEELVKMRKPYLRNQSDSLLEELKEDNLMPNLPEFGIYDEDSYDDLLKTIYTIAPSLFVGKSDSEKKFICTTFAGLLSTQDDILIKVILEQLQELTEDEKKDLLDILNR